MIISDLMMGYTRDLLVFLPHDLLVFLIAMCPITEMRVAIPFAISVYHMDPYTAFLYAVTGNVLFGIITLIFVEHIIHVFLKRSRKLRFFWQKYIDCVRVRNKENFEKWGSIGLVIFIAVPLPLTGVISGAIAASIFQVPLRRAIPLLSVGGLLAGVIMTTLTVSAVYIF